VAQKKVAVAGLTREELRTWIETEHNTISATRQCELVGLPRSSRYYEPQGETPENLALMRRLDEVYTRWPFYGSRKLSLELGVNRKRVQRLMRRMGIAAIGPHRRTTKPHPGHLKYPYLLRNMDILRPDHVWSTDISVPQKRRERWEFGLPQSACRSRLQTAMSGCG